MKHIRIAKGLDLRIAGAPDPDRLPIRKDVTRVSLVGSDYVGMKPTILVEVGEKVLAGQPLFEDKKNPGVKFVSPIAGVVKEVVRGEKRAFKSIVVEAVEGTNIGESVQFEKFSSADLVDLCPNKVRELLVKSGMWTALRTRPFSRIPKIDAAPVALFVNAADTNPLAPDPKSIIDASRDEFLAGLRVLSKICGKRLIVCFGKGGFLKNFVDAVEAIPYAEAYQFTGPHPAGLVGTHIAKLEPCALNKVVWSIGYQDVIAVGELFATGRYYADRVVTLAGPMVKNPRVLRVVQGAFVTDLADGDLKDGPARLVSGSPLCGREVAEGVEGLGRYANQIVALREDDSRDFMGWILPSREKFSIARTVLSAWLPRKSYDMTTQLGGGPRAIFPNPAFEKVTPLDLVPTFLFKALEIGDIDRCERLGAFELDEEDLALCSVIDVGKNDYGKTLRALLDVAMKEEE